MRNTQGYWASIQLEPEKQLPLTGSIEAITKKFPEAIVTLPPKGWYRTQPRVDTGWGCGYRNAQNMLSSLLDIPEFSQRLPNFVPSVPSIQLLIETAWQNGFDSVGAAQLNWELCGTKKWIGATEVATLLAFLGIESEVIDFTAPTSRTPSGKPVHKALVECIHRYLLDKIPFPLYLQFAGHSQTVVGIRPPDKGVFLLDPGARGSSAKPPTATFLPTQATNHDQYQLVAITGIVDGTARDRLKRTFNHRKIS